jgi:hypothetical protein
MLYREQPWEKEAFARMNGLAQDAITSLPFEDQAWLKDQYVSEMLEKITREREFA